MNVKFATATAISLVMVAAPLANDAVLIQGYANSVSSYNLGLIDQSAGVSNVAKVTQLGNTNEASILQNGSSNRAGTHLQGAGLDPWDAYSGYNYMTQSGTSNSLKILQTGNHNIVAVDGNLTQTGNFNSADIKQTAPAGLYGGNNQVASVTQAATATATAATNVLKVTQSGAAAGTYPGLNPSDYNYSPNLVASVVQTWTGATAAINSLTITQSGAVHSRGNVVSSAVQNGAGNTATVTQAGHSNKVAVISQIGTTNSAVITLEGNLNGSTAFSTGPAATVGITQGEALQNGANNNLAYDVLGSNNLFSFKQVNDSNDIRGEVIGDNNQIAVSQTGNGNHSFTQQMGGSNNAGIIQ